ncbi:hypothetical protein Hdeb2414_s0018g00523371 [Helianthus debilis subsp. tardiflorus]
MNKVQNIVLNHRISNFNLSSINHQVFCNFCLFVPIIRSFYMSVSSFPTIIIYLFLCNREEKKGPTSSC